VRRALTTFDVTCIGVNAIVGSGIYLFPGKLSATLGSLSIASWVLTGALCLPLAFTFAALGRLETRSGGAFRYAQLAFGSGPAFVVGWCAWVTSVLSWAAVASGVPRYLGEFAPALGQGVHAHLATGLIVLGLGGLNVCGVKPGARVTDILTLGKLVPLLVFVLVGLFAVRFDRVASGESRGGLQVLPAMALMTMFAYQGFEVVGIPAGEVRDPKRAVPRAVLISVILAALLYTLVQVVFVGVGGSATDAPLPDAAAVFLGPSGAVLLTLGGLISMLGFNAGTALCTPRYLQALAEERLVPSVFGWSHPRFETPAIAIAASTLVTFALTWMLDFERLIDLAVLAVLAQYLASAAALVKLGDTLRKKLLGLVSIAVSIGFGLQCTLDQFRVLGVVTLVGVVIAVLTGRVGRAMPRSTPD
jgi:basic amino acid/polyamine antiporter, APA family